MTHEIIGDECKDMPHPISLGGILLEHTWSIHLAGPLTKSLKIQMEYRKLEQEISTFLQSQQRDATSRSNSSDNDDEENDRELTVRLMWGACELENQQKVDTPIPKRRKLDGDSIVISQAQHFIVDIRDDGVEDDEVIGQLVFCYPSITRDNTVERFDFLLTRGSKRCVERVLGFLGCSTTSSNFCPTVADVARSATLWTTEHWHMANNPTNQQLANIKMGEDSNRARASPDGSSLLKATKPLTLTYAVPSGPAGDAGLETISLTVPPLALLGLCNKIIFNKNKAQKAVQGQDTPKNINGEKDTIPIVIALQCFLRETFRIKLDKFVLTKASCSAAVLGCDGRCKPFCAALLPNILQEIRHMTTQHTPE